MPYANLPPKAFWKSCRETADFRMADLHDPAFPLPAGTKVATAGSCFAQNVRPWLEASELQVMDVEPAPPGMTPDVARRFGYGLFSARYGNIYTARQLRLMIEDCMDDRTDANAVWDRDGRRYDALRPGVEPEGLASVEEVLFHRRAHLRQVRRLFRRSQVIVFTLGLTEAWVDATSGHAYPSPPGIIAGRFDPARHQFVNFGFSDVKADLKAAIDLMRVDNPDLKVILTVSPVPLTATASGGHVLSATTYSKSVLRAVAGEIAAEDTGVDYFPAYEIIAGTPFGADRYKSNLRDVTASAVAEVMKVFFAAYGLTLPEMSGAAPAILPGQDEDDAIAICEDALLDAFAGRG
ncbi:GSCFA domain-containing protein [Chachezhania antarctica]|uniref:GSCFA domain-containing protein n=1 Tax=Chachezhania antarctica TaxID=2340860 RepID=UPI0013CEDFA1|nr:GSCFA domain-containing protein [Chachezhania antarctica]|tara:strand:- start:2932 stop:3984 length:1053 start_codon:yes stop_codon:yes gene_type:complete